MRQFLVGGNWKMNGNKVLVDKLVSALNQSNLSKTQVVIAPPAPYLSMVRQQLSKHIDVASQNIHEKESGAFTGETSVMMLKDLDIAWTIIGHSERRVIFKEDDQLIALKVKTACEAGLKVILCCGETLQEREANQTIQVVTRQLEAVAKVGVDWSQIVIAYEPVWAIGTGKVATPQQAQQVHKDIRQWISQRISPDMSNKIRVLYGGSVNQQNCQLLAKEEDIDGFLVGGASLKPEFIKICQCLE